jgi:DNA repair protein RadC
MKPYKQTQLSVHSIKELPVEDRPREKLIESGTPSLTDTELLAALLGSGSARTPAHVLAAKVQEVLDKHAADEDINALHLQEIDGMGPAKAAIVCAALELGRRRLPARRKQIIFPADIFPLIRHFGDREQEHFLCVPLNGAHEVISVHVVSIGLVNHTLVHPRDVLT